MDRGLIVAMVKASILGQGKPKQKSLQNRRYGNGPGPLSFIKYVHEFSKDKPDSIKNLKFKVVKFANYISLKKC